MIKDINIDDINQKIKRYESLPLKKKIGKEYDSIKNEIDEIKISVVKMTELINVDVGSEYLDQEFINDAGVPDDDKFEMLLRRSQEITKELNLVDVNKELKLYLELKSISFWIKNYMKNQKMNIIE